jgi:hypothetical protein
LTQRGIDLFWNSSFHSVCIRRADRDHLSRCYLLANARGEVRQPETNAVGKARQPAWAAFTIGPLRHRVGVTSPAHWRPGQVTTSDPAQVPGHFCSTVCSIVRTLHDLAIARGAKMGNHSAKSRQESGGVWTVICPGKQHFANLLDSSRPARGLIHTEEVTGSIPVSPTRSEAIWISIELTMGAISITRGSAATLCEPGRCWTSRFCFPGDSLRTRFR